MFVSKVGEWLRSFRTTRPPAVKPLTDQEFAVMKACGMAPWGACDCPHCIELYDFEREDGTEGMALYCTIDGHDATDHSMQG